MRIFLGLQNENEIHDLCKILEETGIICDLEISFFKISNFSHPLNFKGILFIFHYKTRASLVY